MSGQPPKRDTPPQLCTCERPQPQQFAAYKGGARTVCARCGLQVPLRLSNPPPGRP